MLRVVKLTEEMHLTYNLEHMKYSVVVSIVIIIKFTHVCLYLHIHSHFNNCFIFQKDFVHIRYIAKLLASRQQ